MPFGSSSTNSHARSGGVSASNRRYGNHSNSEASASSRTQAWGRPLSAACSTENTTGSGGGIKLGLSSLGLDNEDADSLTHNTNNGEDNTNNNNHNEDLNPPAVAQAVTKRLTAYRKQKKSLFSKMTRSPPVLNLSGLGVATLPLSNVQEMETLQVEKVNLSKNDSLIVVPELVVKGWQSTHCLAHLQSLDLSKCHLQSLLSEWNLPNLQTLDLSHNRLKDFPSKSVLRGVPLLKTLDLYGNRLIHLPDFGPSSHKASNNNHSPDSSGEFEMTTSTHERVNASAAALSSSSQISTMRKSSLDMSVTSTSRRPSVSSNTGGTTARRPSLKKATSFNQKSWIESGCLLHLTTLNVGYNDLTCLPEGLPPKLKVLIACNNYLSVIPEVLILGSAGSGDGNDSPQQQLKELDVTSNPIQYPPPEICESGLRTMRKWIQEHGTNGTAMNNNSNHSNNNGNGGGRMQQRASLSMESSNSQTSASHRRRMSHSSTRLPASHSAPSSNAPVSFTTVTTGRQKDGYLAKKASRRTSTNKLKKQSAPSNPDAANTVVQMLGL